MAQLAKQTYQLVKVGDLEPHPENPHRGDVDSIAESIEENNFYGVVIVQQSRMRIIAGEHRWLGAQRRGLEEIPAVIVDVDDETAKRMLIGDNRTAALGYDDQELLAEVLASLADLAGTGYTPDDLGDLTRLTAPPDLDDFAEAMGPAAEDDGWVTIKIKVPRPVNAAWNNAAGETPAITLATMLGVDWQWGDEA